MSEVKQAYGKNYHIEEIEQELAILRIKLKKAEKEVELLRKARKEANSYPK